MSAAATASKRGTGISLGFIFAVVMILHFTNPSYQKHIAKKGYEPASVSYADRFSYLYSGTTSRHYHDYIIFSTTDGSSGNTFGILGMVF
ncbi:MAG: hypothetical protein JST86_06690 [Bacteroidetes bacterium]|nr:hypothetical protein [Bacteroidota bacterium]